METIYPVGPTAVPAGFTRPGASYRRRAWFAVAGLLTFLALYLALTAWFAMTGVTRLLAIGTRSSPLELIVCACSLFLAVFLVKALFFIKKGEYAGGIELKRAEQPRLFAFLDRVADEAGAPRPHKIYVSGRVNASVFYDLSPLNLIFPSRKNLEIGLGLVNMLNLSEFKAVCAHEFGHFAQRSMALGRWVYTAQQIAAHIVSKRDALDRFLGHLSRIDYRVAWIGWVLSLIIWALRAVVDSAFRLVIIVQRALSREMEMQADRVAVSLTGSDALVHALHRLQIADDAWDRTLLFLRGETGAQRPPRDAFDVQHAIAARLGRIYNDSDYGRRPQVPASEAAAFRVFKGEMAQPPQMWATHPMNHEREENAKRTYLCAPEDERSAWLVFDDAPALRESITRQLVGDTDCPPAESDVTLQRLDEQFARERLKPCYRGIYLAFSATRHTTRANDLYESTSFAEPLTLEALYPASIGSDLEKWRSLVRELALLRSLRDGVYVAADGVIRHRGGVLRRNDLPAAIAAVDEECRTVRTRLESTLKRVRSFHLAVAKQRSPEWHAYLRGLVHVLHYANHAEANLRDAQAALALAWQRATAAGSINERGVKIVLAAAEDVQRALHQIFREAPDLRPGEQVLADLNGESWAAMLGELGLGVPVRENINDWLRVVDGWVNHASACLSALGGAALDELLRTETMIAAAAAGEPLAVPPLSVPAPPPAYDTLALGDERALRANKPDLWERFQSATGFLPGLARSCVAVGIIGTVLAIGWSVGKVSVIVYNGLAQSVVATVNGQRVELKPGSHAEVEVHGGLDVQVVTQTLEGEPIESFSAAVRRKATHMVYTVASAAPLREWTATYGSANADAPRLLSPQRWQAASADVVFARPPERINTRGGGVRTVVDAADDTPPDVLASQLEDKAGATAMILAHVRFDAPDSPYLANWLALASEEPGFEQAFAERRVRFPVDVIAMRTEQDLAKGAPRAALCARHRALAEATPIQPALAYLATRCMPEGPQKEAAFEAGARRWPDSAWYANAVGWQASEHGRYREALERFDLAMSKNPALRQMMAGEALRLTRLLDPAAARSRQDAASGTLPMLRNLLAFEPGPLTVEGPMRPIALLANGRLDEAVAAADGTQVYGHVLRLAAASRGASPELRARARTLSADDGIDGQTVWLAVATGADTGIPAVRRVLDSIVAQYDKPGVVAQMERFFALVRRGDPVAAERVLDGLPLQLRAQALVAGIHLLGDRAPADWRTFAQRVLFAAERPYMGQS